MELVLTRIPKRKTYTIGRFYIKEHGGPDFNHLFKGIRIHMGNTAADTAGCILVGRNQLVGRLLESRKWLYELKQLIVAAKARNEPVWLTIR